MPELERYEWDDIWFEKTDVLDKKRVVYIGDSISRGMRSKLNEIGAGEILFDNLAGSKALDNPALEGVLRLFFAQEQKVDAVLFNNGLHGFHLGAEEYRALYEKTVLLLRELAPEAVIAVVLTTPAKKPETMKTVLERNAAATDVARKFSLPVVDLFTHAKDLAQLDDGIHFKTEIQPVLAGFVVESVKKLLDL